MPPAPPDPTFFATPEEFRAWLEGHHADATELWVGFHKKGSGRASVTWPESVDEALCFGWIDGVRKSLGDEAYVIRFTPRKPTSNWSAVNIRRVEALTREGRMRPAGLAAFARRSEDRSRVYSFEQKEAARLDAGLEAEFRAHPAAWEHFASRPPGYRRTAVFWVMSARREETRRRRLAQLVESSAGGRPIPLLDRTPAARNKDGGEA